MKYAALALCFLAVGCDNTPLTTQKMADTFTVQAFKALKHEAPGDLRKKDFTIAVYTPSGPDVNGDLLSIAIVCGKVAGREANGWRGTDTPVFIAGGMQLKGNKISKTEIYEVLLLKPGVSKDPMVGYEIEAKNRAERCEGQPFSWGKINFSSQVIQLNDI